MRRGRLGLGSSRSCSARKAAVHGDLAWLEADGLQFVDGRGEQLLRARVARRAGGWQHEPARAATGVGVTPALVHGANS